MRATLHRRRHAAAWCATACCRQRRCCCRPPGRVRVAQQRPVAQPPPPAVQAAPLAPTYAASRCHCLDALMARPSGVAQRRRLRAGEAAEVEPLALPPHRGDVWARRGDERSMGDAPVAGGGFGGHGQLERLTGRRRDRLLGCEGRRRHLRARPIAQGAALCCGGGRRRRTRGRRRRRARLGTRWQWRHRQRRHRQQRRLRRGACGEVPCDGSSGGVALLSRRRRSARSSRQPRAPSRTAKVLLDDGALLVRPPSPAQ